VVINRGRDAADIHVLPHAWFRNTWSWTHGATRPAFYAAAPGAARTNHPVLGERWWYVRAIDGTIPPLLFTENETNTLRLFGHPNARPCVKDGINDAVVYGRREGIEEYSGSQAAAHLRRTVAADASFTAQVRLSPRALAQPFDRFDSTVEDRIREADEFYAAVQRHEMTADERLVQRQAFAGVLWSKQFYHYNVHDWLSGDPAQPPPPPERRQGRNRDWALHFQNAEIVLMPDKWEYPWYASWDLAFQAVVIATIDPAFAKEQMLLLTHPGTQHPYGAIPAFEWDFSAANPPIIAWAVWQIYQLDRRQTGTADVAFLDSMFPSLLMMLGWWLNRKDSNGNGIFTGGFLGLDNIGVFDRERPLPTVGSLEQGDATGWMAMFQLNMADIAFELALHNSCYTPMVHRCGQDFVIVASVLQRTAAGGIGLWNEEGGFYFDAIRHGSDRMPLRIYSMAGLVPLFAASVASPDLLARLPVLQQTVDQILCRPEDLPPLLPSYLEPPH